MTQTIATPAIDRSAVAALSAAQPGEPKDVREARLLAFDRYLDLPAPDERTPGWRRTDIRGIALTPVAPRESVADIRIAREDRAAGAAAARLDSAAASDAAALREVSVGPSTGRFSALAQALWVSGAHLRIPKGLTGAAPIVIEWRGGPYPRSVIEVGENAAVSIVERHAHAEPFSAGVADLRIGAGARVTYVHVQDMPRTSVVFSHQRARLGRGARLIALNFAVGGRLSRADIEVLLEGQGAESDMLGLVFGEGDQQFDFHTLQGHRAPDTRSDLLFKSALDDRSHSTYTGIISIGADAPRSEAYQADRNLLLASGARADTEPKLEILIDDVARCTHGATVGPVDDEMLFYLRSRGIEPRDATRMIVEGFFEEVLRKAGDERATAGLTELLAPHIGRLEAR